MVSDVLLKRTKMRVAGFVDDSVVDGPGVRRVVFLQGCRHNCPGCHNPSTHSVVGGQEMTCFEVFQRLTRGNVSKSVTLSGGDPLYQPYATTLLLAALRQEGYSTWVYTGYTWERLLQDPGRMQPVMCADVLVDGPFVQELQSRTAKFRGSTNQRIIDVKESLRLGEVVEIS